MNWDRHIQTYLSSGLSVARYCETAEVKSHQFKYRYNKYRQQQAQASKKSAEIVSEFVPVKIKETASQKRSDFEIHFPNGCCCLVSVPFNASALAQIIEMLR